MEFATLLSLLLALLSAPPGPAKPASAAASSSLPVDAKQEAALLRDAGTGFAIKRTAHFVVAHNVPPEVADELTARFERTYLSIYRFCEHNRIQVEYPKQRLEAFFFDRREEYDRYGARISFSSPGTFGVYSESSNRSAFLNVHNDPQFVQLHASLVASRQNLDQLSKAIARIRDNRTVVELSFSDGRQMRLNKQQANRELNQARRELKRISGQVDDYSDRINRTVIQHETAHQTFYNAGLHRRGSDNPRWLVEGLACLFETPPSSEGVGIAAINRMRLDDFLAAVSGDREFGRVTAEDVRNAIVAGRIASPRDLITRPGLYQQHDGQGAVHYAVTWAFLHYLHRTRTDQLGAFLRAVSDRRPGQRFSAEQELALFERHFGPLDETLLQRWSAYICKLRR
ncbi:MAG: DUF1570 domain-containing protein [Phycisphaerae bacterium]|nr:DUF1570 domain-containing protein [Phycisphaerae bacterium]